MPQANRLLATLVSLALTATTFRAVGGTAAQAPSAQAPSAQAPSAPAAGSARPAPSGTEFGFAFFQTRCTACHGNPALAGRAPDPATLRQMPPERIYAALTTGSMAAQAHDLSDAQKRRLAEFMSGRPLGSAVAGDVKSMSGRCAHNAALTDPERAPLWSGWGADVLNSRYQRSPGVSPAQAARLRLRWAFGFPRGVSAFAQPSVAAGRVFVGSDIGFVYSLDARHGCAYWSYQALGSVRTAISIASLDPPVASGGPRGSRAHYAVYFGDNKANVYALDAHSGKLLWRTKVEDHFAARITGAPTIDGGVVYAPVSASEGFAASAPSYACCTFRGSVAALDARTGRLLWKAYVVRETPRPVRRNEVGTQLWAPAGGSVWDAPTVDELRHAVYFGTGDAETQPASANTDAVMAVDTRAGKPLWVHQMLANDAWIGGCGGPAPPLVCPRPLGPDRDIGNSPILRTLATGRRVLVAATKDGLVFALDPDREGALLWQTRVAPESKEGSALRPAGVLFGGAADEERAYYPLGNGTVVAVDLATGALRWSVQVSPPTSSPALAAAPTVIPGVLFLGGYDGKLYAIASADGHPMWQYDTNRRYHTVNGVPARGGSMGSAGPTIAGGMLFVGAGYGVTSGTPGNVLLAFAPDTHRAAPAPRAARIGQAP